MEITQIKDCQNILKIGQALETEEERKCDELFGDKNTIEWLKGRKSNLDKVIEEIEGKILDKGGILSKQKLKESEKEKINNELESKTNNLNNIKVAESDIKLQESLKSKISEVENKIKEYESDIYDKGQSKYKVDEEIKNKETNVRYWESQVSSATSGLSSAETELHSAQQRGSYNSCWGGYSPELSNACVQGYRNKIQEKQSTKESYERNLSSARKELNEEKDKSQIYANGITATNNMKNAEIAKKAQYTKEKQEVEAKMKGVLDQKKSLETEIEKQEAAQITINAELLSLEESANNFDSDALETQKGAFEKEFQMIDSLEQKVIEYCEVDFTGRYDQHQEL
jgi:chromosome segregation ATPase